MQGVDFLEYKHPGRAYRQRVEEGALNFEELEDWIVGGSDCGSGYDLASEELNSAQDGGEWSPSCEVSVRKRKKKLKNKSKITQNRIIRAKLTKKAKLSRLAVLDPTKIPKPSHTNKEKKARRRARRKTKVKAKIAQHASRNVVRSNESDMVSEAEHDSKNDSVSRAQDDQKAPPDDVVWHDSMCWKRDQLQKFRTLCQQLSVDIDNKFSLVGKLAFDTLERLRVGDIWGLMGKISSKMSMRAWVLAHERDPDYCRLQLVLALTQYAVRYDRAQILAICDKVHTQSSLHNVQSVSDLARVTDVMVFEKNVMTRDDTCLFVMTRDALRDGLQMSGTWPVSW